jgi:putative methyltransferase (TIGR04325 family)
MNTSDAVKPFNIWEGVYETFQAAAVDATGPGFDGEVYRNRSLAAANECFEALKLGRAIPQFHKQRSTLLPPIVAMLLNDHQNIRILDFGGGLGIGYMTLMESIPDILQKTSYTILENPQVCKLGASVKGQQVTYTSSIGPKASFDLVHAASSLQYVENWSGLIQQFAAWGPEHILLSDVFAGAIASFVTLQNYYGSRIPHWFLNLENLLDAFDESGYQLVMRSYVTSRRLNAEDILPMDNFPQALRLSQSLHLLLRRKRSA